MGFREGKMISEYIEKAMEKAFYEKFEDGTYSGEIPECPGTLAFGKTLYECQRELESTLDQSSTSRSCNSNNY